MTTPENFEQLVEELRKQMNELMMEAVREPMNAAIAQIPSIMQTFSILRPNNQSK